jgi:hypothetical protein
MKIPYGNFELVVMHNRPLYHRVAITGEDQGQAGDKAAFRVALPRPFGNSKSIQKSFVGFIGEVQVLKLLRSIGCPLGLTVGKNVFSGLNTIG